MANVDRGANALFKSADWAKLYQSALLETNSSKLPQKIFDAETAIFKRKLQLSKSVSESGDVENEKAAIDDALLYLVLLREELQH
jgi:hypothetical protein